ncbi:MAG: hypothetical protein LRS49_06220 [Desulfurococcales archaeon]|nr:hypothetical protein [Desulfurococcales archaeon]
MSETGGTGPVEARVYSRLLNGISTLAWERLGDCGRRVAWALPKPARASRETCGFLGWAVLWGPLAGAGGLRDSYGVSLAAYATALCSLLGGTQSCWRLASQAPTYNTYLESCCGVRLPSPGEGEELARLVESLLS